jgi:Asp-tRNA(Asn)/Glu-tRNA(Gln) amidotransferase B subunit
MNEMEWLRLEARRQELILTDEDLEVIAQRLKPIKESLKRTRSKTTEGLEPPSRFLPEP